MTLYDALEYIYPTTISLPGRFCLPPLCDQTLNPSHDGPLAGGKTKRTFDATMKAAMALQTTREQGEPPGLARDARSVAVLVKQEGKKGHQLGSSTTSVGQSRIEY
jgi:hypothetical protein